MSWLATLHSMLDQPLLLVIIGVIIRAVWRIVTFDAVRLATLSALQVAMPSTVTQT